MSDQSKALLDILADVRRAARHVAQEWADVISADDVEQEISLRLLEDNYATVAHGMEVPARRRVLFKIGQQVASNERVNLEHFSGNFLYSTKEVRGLLSRGALDVPGHNVLDGIYFESTDEDDFEPIPANACEISVDHMDVRTAFGVLPDKHRNVLVERYVAGSFDGHPETLSRAVEALTAEMNRAHRRAHEEHNGIQRREVQ